MTQILRNFLTGANNKEFATKTGAQMHAVLQHVIVDESGDYGDKDIIEIIKEKPELKCFFVCEPLRRVFCETYCHGGASVA